MKFVKKNLQIDLGISEDQVELYKKVVNFLVNRDLYSETGDILFFSEGKSLYIFKKNGKSILSIPEFIVGDYKELCISETLAQSLKNGILPVCTTDNAKLEIE